MKSTNKNLQSEGRTLCSTVTNSTFDVWVADARAYLLRSFLVCNVLPKCRKFMNVKKIRQYNNNDTSETTSYGIG